VSFFLLRNLAGASYSGASCVLDMGRNAGATALSYHQALLCDDRQDPLLGPRHRLDKLVSRSLARLAAIPSVHSRNLAMEIKVNFLDKLRLEAKFDDFTVIADQPIRYKGDGSAPGPSITSWRHRPCARRIS
jgi:ribosomal protein S12 methylthiotransferase accessory factor